MQRGDISNETLPRVLLVFEGAIGFLPDKNARAYEKAMAKQHWEDAVAAWELDELMLRKIWDITKGRMHLNVEVVTFLGHGFADVLAARLDAEDLPVGRVWSTTPGKLSRQLAYMPDVTAVYDPDESHVFTYGAKGRMLTSPLQLGEM